MNFFTQVRKEDVDSFTLSETSWIPYSHFRAKFNGDRTAIIDLECDVDVIGARQPHNKFGIDISPEGRNSCEVHDLVVQEILLNSY